MRRPDQPKPPDEPLLFDLPLGGPDDDPEPEPAQMHAPPPRRKAERPARPMPVPDPEPEDDAATQDPAGEFAGRAKRLAAGLADAMLHAAILVAALVGTRWMGVKLDLARDWPPLAVFLLSFSFLYTVLPLAFWGQSLGMAWSGITSRNRDGEPLTFDQTARRWLGGLLTAGTLGLPALVSSRRSLSDLLSGSATYPGGE
jgi:uncharacterized RDD family membrane protein YckC